MWKGRSNSPLQWTIRRSLFVLCSAGVLLCGCLSPLSVSGHFGSNLRSRGGPTLADEIRNENRAAREAIRNEFEMSRRNVKDEMNRMRAEHKAEMDKIFGRRSDFDKVENPNFYTGKVVPEYTKDSTGRMQMPQPEYPHAGNLPYPPTVHDTPPYPVHDTPPYPVHDTPPYPVHDTPPYPVHDTPPYPVHDTPPYPVHDTPPYPVHNTPPYPVHDASPYPIPTPPYPVDTPPSHLVEPPAYRTLSTNYPDSKVQPSAPPLEAPPSYEEVMEEDRRKMEEEELRKAQQSWKKWFDDLGKALSWWKKSDAS